MRRGTSLRAIISRSRKTILLVDASPSNTGEPYVRDRWVVRVCVCSARGGASQWWSTAHSNTTRILRHGDAGLCWSTTYSSQLVQAPETATQQAPWGHGDERTTPSAQYDSPARASQVAKQLPRNSWKSSSHLHWLLFTLPAELEACGRHGVMVIWLGQWLLA